MTTDGARTDDRPRVLVTGATGTVGSALVDTLRTTNAAIRIASRSPDVARDSVDSDLADNQAEPPIEGVEFDLARPETWGEALADVDAMFLLFPPSVGVDPVREFVDAAARVGLEQVVVLSVLGAEKLPILPHRRIERHIEATSLEYTFLRAGWFMQNLSEIHRPEIVERDEIYVPAGTGRLGMIDARDVADVATTVLTEPGHRNVAYDLTGPDALDFEAVADVFTNVLGRQIRYADPGRLEFAWRMYQRGIDPGLVAFMVAEYSVVRLGRSGRLTDDVARLLGRLPRSLVEFVADYEAEFRSEADHGSTLGDR